MTTQNAKTTQQYPHDRAVVIDTFEGVLRAGGPKLAGMLRQMPLIKEYHPHTQHFEIGLEHRLPQILQIAYKQRKKADA